MYILIYTSSYRFTIYLIFVHLLMHPFSSLIVLILYTVNERNFVWGIFKNSFHDVYGEGAEAAPQDRAMSTTETGTVETRMCTGRDRNSTEHMKEYRIAQTTLASV